MALKEAPLFQVSGTDTHPGRNYSLRDNSGLHAFVDQVEIDGPKGFIKPGELEKLSGSVDVSGLMQTLPSGFSGEEFAGVLQFSLLTECATDTYARGFVEGAVAHNQLWFARFIERVWTPDEHSHYLPFKSMLLQLGFSEEELDRDIKEARERDYAKFDGYTPIQLTMYGMIQEYLTDHWYAQIHRILRPSSPVAAHMVGRVKQRETFHTLWYRDMTALQIEDNPSLLPQAADTASDFEMPSAEIAPELQKRAEDENWLRRVGSKKDDIKKDLMKLASRAMASHENTGRFIVEMAVRKGINLGPFKPEHIRGALNKFDRIGGPAYGIIGEALLESVGITRPFIDHEQGPVDKARAAIRTWVAHQIKFDV